MTKVVGVKIDGRPTWHAAGIGPTDYATLCGIDADDPQIGHQGRIDPPRGQKITCEICRTMWLGFRSLRLRASNFQEQP